MSKARTAAQLEPISDISRLTGRILQTLVVGFCVMLAAGSAGCSSFERDWRTAQAYAYPADDIAGCWEGTWESHTNGHNGTLRAILTKQGENYYHAQFKATYAYIIPFEFEVPMMVTRDGGLHAFEGQADLGRLAGGVYSYAGQATPCDFNSSYCAKKDHGLFTMTRLPSCVQCYDGCGDYASCSDCQSSETGCCDVHANCCDTDGDGE